MKKIIFIILNILLLASCSYKAEQPDPDDKVWEEIKKNYHIYAPPLPKKLDFAGEPVPLQYFDVRRSLDKEILKIMFWHSETILYIKRSATFFPIVEPILKKYGVPDDFKYLLVAESGMTNVVSPSGAVGYWQFMERTAKKYGLIINNEVDQRYDIIASTQAACRYLLDAYNELGSWTLAAASYNSGKSYIKRQLARQKVDNFYDLAVNVETGRYIYRILAFKLILSNPQKYGFYVRKQDMYYPIKTKVIVVKGPVNSWIDFAHKYGTNYKILLLLNPWIRSDKLTNPNNYTFYVKVPASKEARIVKH